MKEACRPAADPKTDSRTGPKVHPKKACPDSWSKAPSPLTFPKERVDVWKLNLDTASALDSNLLSPDERERARRFHFDKDRLRFTRCRCALRSLLSAYIGVPAGEIQFDYLPAGKPQLTAAQNPRRLQFNVSHSGGMALIALATARQIGVDIEKMKTTVDTSALAERFFSRRERDALRALPDHLRVAGFYACWTRKESFLKATGDGLSFPLADFSVTTHPDLAPAIEEIRGDHAAGKRWFLANLPAIDGFRATVALQAPACPLETHHLAKYDLAKYDLATYEFAK